MGSRTPLPFSIDVKYNKYKEVLQGFPRNIKYDNICLFIFINIFLGASALHIKVHSKDLHKLMNIKSTSVFICIFLLLHTMFCWLEPLSHLRTCDRTANFKLRGCWEQQQPAGPSCRPTPDQFSFSAWHYPTLLSGKQPPQYSPLQLVVRGLLHKYWREKDDQRKVVFVSFFNHVGRKAKNGKVRGGWEGR